MLDQWSTHSVMRLLPAWSVRAGEDGDEEDGDGDGGDRRDGDFGGVGADDDAIVIICVTIWAAAFGV